VRQASLLAGLRTEEMAFFSFTRGYLGFQFRFCGSGLAVWVVGSLAKDTDFGCVSFRLAFGGIGGGGHCSPDMYSGHSVDTSVWLHT